MTGVLRIRPDEHGHWVEILVDGKVWGWAGPFPDRADAERELEDFRKDAARYGLDPELVQLEQ